MILNTDGPSFAVNILGSEANDVINILVERERGVVGRFSLDTGGEERTQWEIAKDLVISRSYVSRIEKRALMKL